MEKELEKIFEDENMVVINKPSGLVVNRSNTSVGRTLQDILDEEYFSKVVDTKKVKNENEVDVKDEIEVDIENEKSKEEFANRSGLVHRLDKDTSGVLLIAKNLETFIFLQKQFKERNVYKEYVALVHGRVEEELLEIDAPLARNPNSPLKYAIVSTGKAAVTKIEKIKEVKVEGLDYTLLKILPQTGRTHQIRVHLSAIGHPIVADVIYCANNLLENDLIAFGRLMLHARFLGFLNPKTQKFQKFEALLPKVFQF